ncbi:hypothetical protein EVJ27_01225 [Exiguobacterium sp. SH3S2]|uniref:hypothetical protein n=1 Tax=unclassified Exiguobacterium TaxID=2644629 RepID=UPI00103ADE6D|nr:MULTISPECIES: hypothetical protein [unclassified Exiguobacterium]TCI49264.1 hypothetical protein EVJ28_01225 [Exiguobacterium sp. SH3S3]TCI64577.1 hypothetical protein EVJ27_01225 [Exiguobacterium sp. SH3S2]
MTFVLLIAGIVIAYGLLIGFRQIQTLNERVNRLESEKRETEALLLSFMESMSDVVKNDAAESPKPTSTEIAEIETETSEDGAVNPSVEEVLLRHSVRDTARLLGKGEGEVALYAKLRQK